MTSGFLDRSRAHPYTSHDGQVAEWLRSGLQSRVHRFESGPGLQSLPRFPALGYVSPYVATCQQFLR